MPKKSSAVPKLAMGCKVFSYSTNPFDLEIGGRNQNTQLCLNECVGGGVAVFESVRDAFEGLVPRSLICFSAVGVFAAAPTTLLKSSAPPGVLGPFEDPKDAKAPDPSPNALAAPAVGEARELPEGDIALKGFLLLCEDVSPCLLPRV